eukprot:c5623_g1_i1 orf=155-397(-)
MEKRPELPVSCTQMMAPHLHTTVPRPDGFWHPTRNNDDILLCSLPTFDTVSHMPCIISQVPKKRVHNYDQELASSLPLSN